jgi:hypothetical protein
VIPKGSVGWGTITEAQAKRRMARGGKLDMNIDAVRLSDGEKCPLRAVKGVKGGGHTGAMTAGIVATSLIVWPAAPFFLFMHGKDITIPEGTEITAYINGDMKLDPAKFASVGSQSGPPAFTPAVAVAAEAPKTATAATAIPTTKVELTGNANPGDSTAVDPVSVAIKSTPDGADITIDGKFVGSTPSTLKLSLGDHTISVGSSGFKNWQRTMTLSAGSDVTLNAALEKTQETASR